MSQGRTLLVAMAVVGVSILSALLLAEMALRLIGYSNPSFYQIDPVLGSSLYPNTCGWWTKEGKAYVCINSDGLRDVEHSIEKPSGVYRIAILGDSYAEGLQLPLEQLFWKILERKLSECDYGKGKKDRSD